MARTRTACPRCWRKLTSYSAEIEFDDSRRLHELFGSHDANVRALEASLEVSVALTGNGVTIEGEHVQTELAALVLRELYDVAGRGHSVQPEDVGRAIDVLSHDRTSSLGELYQRPVHVGSRGRAVVAKTVNQRFYVDAMREHDVVFAVGPAGTGKTYLAMAMAVARLVAGDFDRIILTRPAVEAGERLGFLPGDLAEKVNPYLRPLYDALHAMVGVEKAGAWVEREVVEVAPLAFMRGRTLNNAFIILDEAQNTTPEQMKMFLTRIGFDSQAVITGDITQVDLPGGQVSGLRDAREVLADIADIGFVYFDDRDVVRHPLVKRIIGAYEQAENGRRRATDERG